MSKKSYHLSCLLICLLIQYSTITSLQAQEKEEKRLNLELGTGLSTFKNHDPELPSVAANFALSMWTPSNNIFSLELFATSGTNGIRDDNYTNFSILYGKMLRSKKRKSGFISFHGGIGYSYFYWKSKNIEKKHTSTVGLTGQLRTGLAFEKSVIELIAYQKLSFEKAGNFAGVSLQFSVNLSKVLSH